MTFLAAFSDEGFVSALTNNLIVGIVPVIALIIFFVLVVRLANRKRTGDTRQKTADMLEADNAANLSRNKEIGEQFFYTPNIDKLPIAVYTDKEMAEPAATYMWQERVAKAAEKKMLHFDKQYSNVELKQMFGASNLEAVARYEENFTNFIHSMRNWAEALIAAEKTENARVVLEESVEAGSELSQTYTILADIYSKNNDTPSLIRLKTNLETSPMPGKNIAIKHINKLMEGTAK